MKKQNTPTTSANKERKKQRVAVISRTDLKRVIDTLDDKSTWSITTGIGMEPDPKKEAELDHYQYGPLWYSLIQDIIKLQPKPKKLNVVVTDYLHRHNLKIKTLLEILNNQNTDFDKKTHILEHVILHATHEFIQNNKVNTPFSEETQELIKQAEKEAAAQATQKGTFWAQNHEEQTRKILNQNGIEYECYTWQQWYDSTDHEDNAKTNIPLIHSLYQTDSIFREYIDRLAHDFLKRIAWLPQNDLKPLKEDADKINHAKITEVQTILKKLLHEKYRIFLGPHLVSTIKVLIRKKESQLTTNHRTAIQKIINQLAQLLALTQQAINTISRTYLLEEAASAKWFASLSSFAVLTYKDQANPAFTHALSFFKAEEKLPFVPYHLPEIKNHQINQSELSRQLQSITPVQGKALTANQSEETIIAQSVREITASPTPSELSSFNALAINSLLNLENSTFEEVVNPIKIFIDQEMKKLEHASEEEREEKAQSILNCIMNHKNRSVKLTSAIMNHLITQRFIKDHSPEPDANAYNYKISANKFSPNNHSNFTAIPRTMESSCSHKRKVGSPSVGSPSPEPPHRFSLHSFFRRDYSHSRYSSHLEPANTHTSPYTRRQQP
jgi:hypothetical protein